MSDISINRKLNFVIPIENDDGTKLYVHSTPIRRETFELYFKVIAKAFSEIYAGGLGITSAPRVAAMLIKQHAQEMGIWDGPKGVKHGLMEEIRRLSNVVAPSGHGWELIPLDDAISQNIINEDDASEVENAICYFIVASAMHKKAELGPVLELVSKLWSAQVSSLNVSEFVASLPILTATGNSGAKEIVSSIPS